MICLINILVYMPFTQLANPIYNLQRLQNQDSSQPLMTHHVYDVSETLASNLLS